MSENGCWKIDCSQHRASFRLSDRSHLLSYLPEPLCSLFDLVLSLYMDMVIFCRQSQCPLQHSSRPEIYARGWSERCGRVNVRCVLYVEFFSYSKVTQPKQPTFFYTLNVKLKEA